MEPTAHRLYTLLLFAVTLCLIVPAYADSISGTFDGNATLTPTGTTGVYIQNFSGDGTDDRYGAFDVTSMSTVDFSNPPNITFTDGMLLETFGGGTLFGTGSGTGMANGHGMATFTIDFVITGGTGIFFGDHGSATITGDITQTGPIDRGDQQRVVHRHAGHSRTVEPGTAVSRCLDGISVPGERPAVLGSSSQSSVEPSEGVGEHERHDQHARPKASMCRVLRRLKSPTRQMSK